MSAALLILILTPFVFERQSNTFCVVLFQCYLCRVFWFLDVLLNHNSGKKTISVLVARLVLTQDEVILGFGVLDFGSKVAVEERLTCKTVDFGSNLKLFVIL
jgi:hypothetical protein